MGEPRGILSGCLCGPPARVTFVAFTSTPESRMPPPATGSRTCLLTVWIDGQVAYGPFGALGIQESSGQQRQEGGERAQHENRDEDTHQMGAVSYTHLRA